MLFSLFSEPITCLSIFLSPSGKHTTVVSFRAHIKSHLCIVGTRQFAFSSAVSLYCGCTCILLERELHKVLHPHQKFREVPRCIKFTLLTTVHSRIAFHVYISLMETFSEPKDDAAKGKPHTAAFTWKDALNLESSLTEEEIMVRDQFHAYCQSKLMPRVTEANRNEGKVHCNFHTCTVVVI